jgi:hypothetical protein
MPNHLLIAHGAHPAKAVEAVTVFADIRRGPSVLTYSVDGAFPLNPAPAVSERTDGLWQHTCFELFVAPVEEDGYFEFNFSPSTQWAAYRFDGYRAGMADFPIDAPIIESMENGARVVLDLGALPEGEWRVGITAVIEERDGTKSYWALAHPGEKPDFHDAGGFVLTV